MNINKQRPLDEIPQGGIVDDINLLSLGYCHNDSILSKGQCVDINRIVNTMSNVNLPTINSSGAINISFECTKDMKEEIIKKINDESSKKKV